MRKRKPRCADGRCHRRRGGVEGCRSRVGSASAVSTRVEGTGWQWFTGRRLQAPTRSGARRAALVVAVPATAPEPVPSTPADTAATSRTVARLVVAVPIAALKCSRSRMRNRQRAPFQTLVECATSTRSLRISSPFADATVGATSLASTSRTGRTATQGRPAACGRWWRRTGKAQRAEQRSRLVVVRDNDDVIADQVGVQRRGRRCASLASTSRAGETAGQGRRGACRTRVLLDG